MFASYLCLKSPYRILLGKPFLQILIPSSTPLQRSWWITRWCSMMPKHQHRDKPLTIETSETQCISCHTFWLGKPGVLVSFGIRHLTKWGWVLLRFVINLPRFSYQRKVTLLHKPLYCHGCVSTFTDNYLGITTRKRADTVWKEEPFFFAAFLVVPSMQEEKHDATVMTNNGNNNNNKW